MQYAYVLNVLQQDIFQKKLPLNGSWASCPVLILGMKIINDALMRMWFTLNWVYVP